jgi:lipopolysaccharide transport system ATP-binding protein
MVECAAAPPAEATTGVAPTVFHVTHWKAGSQWVNRILQMLAFDRLVLASYQEQDQFLRLPIQAGMIYPTVYVTWEQFRAVSVPANHRRFVIVRDLRDTLVSYYYSVKLSHHLSIAEHLSLRAELRGCREEAGLLYVLEHFLPPCAAIQESWLRAGEPLVRYEDLLEDDLGIFERLLLRQCELPVPAERLRQVVLACRFEAITGGRQRGQEDALAHERKGIAGDWRNHFTPRLKRAFKERFGELLMGTGYEDDMDW